MFCAGKRLPEAPVRGKEGAVPDGAAVKIQRLDIQGFKSFADRTSIRFGQGITGVVGPNGCGKSNIVDAIRWAMGEQSARMLRGGSMQDVIFNGSAVRGPVGMAEVTLSFDNDGRGLPPEYAHVSEVQVTRRLYRDGESEYEINKTPCRLKDVHDLFLGTGIGTRAYSIISQGQVAEIMRVKPEERRRIIEEAAGITKYKARKEQATRKMESTRQNLQRIDDVTKELGKRLGSLRRQAKKAEKYKEFKTEAREIELHLATLRFFELNNAVGFDRALYASLTGDLKTDVERVATLESAIDEERRVLVDEERVLNERQARLYEIDAAVALATQSADHAKKDYDASQKRDEEAAVDIQKIRDQRAVVEGIKAELLHSQRSLFSEAQADGGNLDAAQADLDEHKGKRGAAAAEVEGLRRQVIDTASSVAKLGAEVNNLKSSAEEMTRRRDAVIEERAPMVDELTRLGEAVTQHDAERQSVEADKLAAEAERKTHSDAIVAEKQRLQAAQRAADDARSELQKRRSRLASLEEIHARYEQSPESVRALLKRGGPLEGKARLLVDLFEANAEWESTIEAGLGARLQSVVIDDEETAQAALGFLHEGKGKGRAELIVDSAAAGPLDVVIDGAVCAKDVVKFGKKANGAVRSILSRLFLVDDVNAALSVWVKARDAGAVVVTKAGDIFEAGGSIRGGVADKEGQGVLRQKREMRELAEDVAAKEAAQHDLDAVVDAARAGLTELDEQLQRATERAQALSLRLVEVEGTAKRVTDELDRLKQRADRLDADATRLKDAVEKATTDVEVKSAQLLEADNARVGLEAELSGKSQALIELDAQIAAKQDAVTTMKVRAASIAERTETLTKSLAQQEAQATDLEERLKRLETQIAEGHVTREALMRQEAEARSQLTVLGEERVSLKATIEGLKLEWEKRAEGVRLKEHEAKAARAVVDAAREQHSGLQVRIRERELELDALTDRTIERHRITPAEVLTDYHMRPLPSDDALEAMEKG